MESIKTKMIFSLRELNIALGETATWRRDTRSVNYLEANGLKPTVRVGEKRTIYTYSVPAAAQILGMTVAELNEALQKNKAAKK